MTTRWQTANKAAQPPDWGDLSEVLASFPYTLKNQGMRPGKTCKRVRFSCQSGSPGCQTSCRGEAEEEHAQLIGAPRRG
jgi:hypothetical protein